MKWGTNFDGVPLSTWGLEQSAPAEIGIADPILYQVEIPGYEDAKTGHLLDLTKSFVGRTAYKNRTIVINCVCRRPRSEWPELRSRIASEIHGKIKKIVFDDDKTHYWYGRCYVESWNADNRIAYPVITIDAAPYRWEAEPISTTVPIDTAATQLVRINGNDVSKFYWNTDYRYGSQSIPTFDFSPYSYLQLDFKAFTPAVHIQFVDGHGAIYNYTSTGASKVQRTEKFTATALQAAGIDMSTIWRILLSSGQNGKVSGGIIGQTVPITGAPKCTEFMVTVPSGVQYLRLGTSVYSLSGGFNSLPDVDLLDEENDLVFTSDLNYPSSGEIEISFRRGYL